MYILYGRVWHSDAPKPEVRAVAEFTSEALAKQYVEDTTLEVYPNGSRRFRRGTLLSCFSNFEIEEKDESLPINPIAPTSPPIIEYIVHMKEKIDKFHENDVLINHGKNRKSAETDLKRHLKYKNTENSYIEERFV